MDMSTKKENGEKLLKLYGIYGFERRTTMTKIQIIIDDEEWSLFESLVVQEYISLRQAM